jgi:hypothetical protein
MYYCEQCRMKEKWPRPMTYPYHRMSHERCERCKKHRECYGVPALFLRPNLSVEEVLLSKAVQNEYKKKAEDLVITYIGGPNHGRIDNHSTEELRKAFTKRDGEIDWYGTYELRKSIQHGYDTMAQLRR